MLFHYQVRQYFLYPKVTDMRKGIDSLCGVVRDELKTNPLLGDLFVFFNRKRNQIKMLHWQGDGFSVFIKRLEQGTYEIPVCENSYLQINAEELLFILQGVVLKSVRKRPRYAQTFVEIK